MEYDAPGSSIPSIGGPAAQAHDVIVLGGGTAGSAVALFTARAKLKTLVLSHGTAAVAPVVTVDNYLGFVEGVGGEELVRLGREHARKWGAEFRDEEVARVAKEGEGFTVTTTTNQVLRAKRIVLASNKGMVFAEQLGLALRTEPWAQMKRRFVKVDEYGRTSLEGIYAAGRITGAPSQALIAAGDGARAAVTLVMDLTGKPYHDHSPYRPGARD